MRSKTNIIITSICICMLLIVAAQGRVFIRWKSASEPVQTLLSLGGEIAYEASMNINGGKGRITAIGYNDSTENVRQRIENAFGIQGNPNNLNASNLLSIETDKSIIKLLIANLKDDSATCVFNLEQSKSDSKKSNATPDYHMMGQIAEYPDSTPTFYANDENTGMSIAIAKSYADPDSVRSFYESHMISSGWTPMLNGTTKGFLVFMKGNKVSCISTDTSSNQNETRITLLHKQQEIH